MRCKDFIKYLNTQLTKLKKTDDPNYDKWVDHMHSCPKCEDKYIKYLLLKKRVKNLNRYSCIHIPHHLNSQDHYLVRGNNDVGIPVPDVGTSYISIKYCPWCSKKIVIKK